MTFLWNAFYFVLALGILVTIHEFGHFWVARKLGVKVLTFSIGFGHPLWQRTAKDGVNYVIAAIPLGGFVKMLDEREKAVPENELSFAFNRKSVWKRMAIVLAGPMANFILALLLFCWVYFQGIAGLNTLVGQVIPGSIASQAGLKSDDLITHVDGNPVTMTSDMIKRIAVRLGETSQISLNVIRDGASLDRPLQLNLNNWQVEGEQQQLSHSLGFKHKIESLSPIVGELVEGQAGEKYGLLKGDKFIRFNQQPVAYWRDLAELIRKNPNKKIVFTIEREGELLDISVVLGSRNQGNNKVGFLGMSPQAPDLRAVRKGDSIGDAFSIALAETRWMVVLSFKLFGKLLTGELSLKNLNGPFSIAEGAGGSARGGLVYFISFVAMISVNLGFINLLPIPLLDGGHLLFFSIEAIKGKPLSERVQALGMQVGMLMVFALMAIAIFNDLSRFIERVH